MNNKDILLRAATLDDLTEISNLYDTAKKLLKGREIDQWQDGYPNMDSARLDIESHCSFVLVDEKLDEKKVIGTACIDVGIEPTYIKIYDGSWKLPQNHYAFVHRVAVDPNYAGKGLATTFFKKAKEMAIANNLLSVRCDTHKDNTAMQQSLKKAGFVHCGTIHLENGNERLAYEMPVFEMPL